jgi:hypothetical protein
MSSAVHTVAHPRRFADELVAAVTMASGRRGLLSLLQPSHWSLLSRHSTSGTAPPSHTHTHTHTHHTSRVKVRPIFPHPFENSQAPSSAKQEFPIWTAGEERICEKGGFDEERKAAGGGGLVKPSPHTSMPLPSHTLIHTAGCTNWWGVDRWLMFVGLLDSLLVACTLLEQIGHHAMGDSTDAAGALPACGKSEGDGGPVCGHGVGEGGRRRKGR